MRFDGKITSWDDDRGFGFIEPALGGEEIFVHVKAISRLRGRPRIAQLVSFEVERGAKGKKRAKNVEPMRPAPRSRATSRAAATETGTATLFAIPAFLIIYLIVALLWHPSRVVAFIYLGFSAITYKMYASDKAAATRGSGRTPENTLHFIALLGGWPGALIAQQRLRHKSSKQPFRTVFWLTVVANVTAFVVLSSPWFWRHFELIQSAA
jgi:uncharacterized membrane protein YsdA (DUF1294 family)/cold shock CspA family protein